jgi:hypothetical protein
MDMNERTLYETTCLCFACGAEVCEDHEHLEYVRRVPLVWIPPELRFGGFEEFCDD